MYTHQLQCMAYIVTLHYLQAMPPPTPPTPGMPNLDVAESRLHNENENATVCFTTFPNTSKARRTNISDIAILCAELLVISFGFT